MTDCRVTCQTCRTDTGAPKTWRWLCETCAQECQDRHRAETGHQTELLVTPDAPNWVQLRRAIRSAGSVY